MTDESEEIEVPNIAAISIFSNLDNPDEPVILDLGSTPASVAFLWLHQAMDTLKFGTMNIEVQAHGEVVIDPFLKGE